MKYYKATYLYQSEVTGVWWPSSIVVQAETHDAALTETIRQLDEREATYKDIRVELYVTARDRKNRRIKEGV